MKKLVGISKPKSVLDGGPKGLTVAKMIRLKKVVEEGRKKVKPQDRGRFVEYFG